MLVIYDIVTIVIVCALVIYPLNKKFGDKFKWYHVGIVGFLIGFLVSLGLRIITGEI